MAQPIVSEEVRSKIYITVFAVAAGVLAWSTWVNYKPQLIKSSCADIATRTCNIYKRSSIIGENSIEMRFNDAMEQCLLDAGYYN